MDKPECNALTRWIGTLANARRQSPALLYGSYRNAHLQNKQIVIERCAEGQRVLVAINADSNPYTARFDLGAARAVDLITGEARNLNGSLDMPPYSVRYWKMG